jgi:hypothetical protein
MNLKGLKISNLICILGIGILMLTSKLEWYYGLLIGIYLLQIKIPKN